MEEHVVLVNENNEVLGTAPKATVHTNNTPLHKAFSCFIFNSQGQLLLQQRSHIKKTWPLVWSNSVCGHPSLNEDNKKAVLRRLKDELGLKEIKIYEVLPNYRYRAEKDGIVENEICPVFIGFSDQKPKINPNEVESTRWIDWQKFVKETKEKPQNWSPWCVEETQLLNQNDLFNKLYKKNTEATS